MSGTVFILLFRGVGGKTQLPTKSLRNKLTEAGFENVATYINSGNAIVRCGLERQQVVEKVAGICAREFGFDKAIHAVTRSEWAELAANNPFPDMVEPGNLLHAAWLEGEPDGAAVNMLRQLASDGDRIEILANVAYLYTPNGFSASKMALKFDKGIGVPNTARNWNTVRRLLEMALAAEN